MRNNALVFQPNSVNDELKKLKTKLIGQWNQESVDFVINLYKN